MRILIVEDESLIAWDLEQIVRDLGHDPLGPVSTAERAKAIGATADLALVDVNLADGRTGPWVAEHLNATYGIPVVFVTGNPEHVKNNFNAIGILNKPFATETVADVIASVQKVFGFHDVANA